MIVLHGQRVINNQTGGYKMARLRKGCSHSKNEQKCKYYSLQLSSCTLHRSKEDCELIKQNKPDHRKKSLRKAERIFRQ